MVKIRLAGLTVHTVKALSRYPEALVQFRYPEGSGPRDRSDWSECSIGALIVIGSPQQP